MRLAAPDAEWSDAEWLLRSIEFQLRVVAWRQTKDGQKGRHAPKPLDTPGQVAEARARRDRALAAKGEIRAALGLPPE